MKKIKTNKTGWDLSSLLKSDTEKNMNKHKDQVKKANAAFVNKWKNRTDYLEKPSVLKEALDEYNDLWAKYGTSGNIGYYFSLKNSLDQSNPKIKAELNKISDFSIKLWNEIQFFSHKICLIPPKKQKKFLQYKGLSGYKHYLETSFSFSKYLLSEPEEKIMNLKDRTSYTNWVRMTSDFISREEREVFDKDRKKKVRNFNQILKLTNEPDKKVRDKAAEAVNEILKKHVDTAETEINSVLHYKKINDELRGVHRPDLNRHIADDIESKIVDILLDTVVKKGFPISKRYYKLKSQLLGVEKMEYHERNVEYGSISKKYPYDKTVSLIGKVFGNLDPEFFDIFKDFVENGKVDVFPKKGKSGGAFCTYGNINQPIYILLNHTNKFSDVTTFAHELGHGINDELVRRAQKQLNYGTPLSTAEVASTFMEDFVLDELEKQADDEMKLSILVTRMDDCVSTILRQVACYKFEQELHEQFRKAGYLSKIDIGKLFKKHMVLYMGNYVKQSPGAENWWVYWGHIRSFFYVYSYASGLLISKSMQRLVKQSPDFTKKVKEFLSAGLTDSPKNIFKKLGIDITKREFWEKGLEEINSLLRETEILAKKLKKI